MSDPILHARDIHKSYMMGPGPLRVLRGASLSVRAGEFVAIMGASGSGKSTLLHILGALDLPDSGTVHFEGADVFARGARSREQMRNLHVGFVFQFYHLLPELTVFENILFPAMVRLSVPGWIREGARARRGAMEVVEQVGLGHRAEHRPNELSGGERQRAAIARALVNHPRQLLADEPTGNLDADTGRGILAVLQELNEQGQTIVMVTHDPDVAALAHRRVHLAEGRIQS
jgi:lipoprotein-releasing system ATP-binding protein